MDELHSVVWRKSSYSANGGNCVEVSGDFPGTVPVRDSKDPHGPVLLFPAATWSAFVTAVRTDRLDTPAGPGR
ncbi:DUF397 domain-containing protein [Kitasatospora sp. NA04385]|uniref:DUF397 domain-containing protein n=1 Tax=Kitasatospora sp. NA04385 TaxID=2742135 RepID=UPI001591B0CA|nr:DUF397 domain-containing protein [Kitasatospora sp. NA04385]QKW18852.1 DUF397 domain-containing protein [Kitasatospora sp. NA04385]